MKMSWGAERNTTREEALAYFLLGLFRVKMPLVYGEGKNAFIRLQREIIKKSDDHSVFTWVAEGYRGQRGILAQSMDSHHVTGLTSSLGEAFRLHAEVVRPKVEDSPAPATVETTS